MVKKFLYGLLAFVLVSSCIYTCSFATGGIPCHLTASKMEVEGSWGLATGCMVKIDGKWIPLSAMRVEQP